MCWLLNCSARMTEDLLCGFLLWQLQCLRCIKRQIMLFLSSVSHKVIEEVNNIQEDLEIEKTCRQSVEALASKVSEHKSAKICVLFNFKSIYFGLFLYFFYSVSTILFCFVLFDSVLFRAVKRLITIYCIHLYIHIQYAYIEEKWKMEKGINIYI